MYPLASLLVTEQISLSDLLLIDRKENEPELPFFKEIEGELVWGPNGCAMTLVPSEMVDITIEPPARKAAALSVLTGQVETRALNLIA